MIKLIKRLVSIGVVVSSICLLPVGASASWKQNSDNTWSYTNINNGWFKDGANWYFFKNGVMQTGWLKEADGKWYYLSSNGKMLSNTTTPDGFKVDNNGVWIQNTNVNSNNTTNTSTNVANTANSNNMTNLTNNVDNSTSNNSSTTLNNTGVINANTTNNVDKPCPHTRDFSHELGHA